MAKLNWYKKAINTQHQRFQNDYAGNMGVKHRKFMAEQAAEEEKLREEALAEEERLERKIRAEMLMNGASMPPDPDWLGTWTLGKEPIEGHKMLKFNPAQKTCLDLLNQGNTI